jgi:hypothetical protein
MLGPIDAVDVAIGVTMLLVIAFGSWWVFG